MGLFKNEVVYKVGNKEFKTKTKALSYAKKTGKSRIEKVTYGRGFSTR